MTALHTICRPFRASSSRIVPSQHQILPIRHVSALPSRLPETTPFFTPPFLPPPSIAYPSRTLRGVGKGKGQETGPPQRKGEEEVDDREWEIRVARAMLHLRDSLPRFFGPEYSSTAMFPQDIFSQNMVLKLPAPLPLKISGLTAYSMAFSIARNGMQALHADMRTNLDRMTFPPTIPISSSPARPLLISRRAIPTQRQKQVRVLISVHGTPRLPPHNETTWQTSSLYTFSPYSGLIAMQEVESIRPLPGEGVAEWLRNRLLGWTKQEEHEVAPCPRAVPMESGMELVRFLEDQRKAGRRE